MDWKKQFLTVSPERMSPSRCKKLSDVCTSFCAKTGSRRLPMLVQALYCLNTKFPCYRKTNWQLCQSKDRCNGMNSECPKMYISTNGVTVVLVNKDDEETWIPDTRRRRGQRDRTCGTASIMEVILIVDLTSGRRIEKCICSCVTWIPIESLWITIIGISSFHWLSLNMNLHFVYHSVKH